MPKLKYASHSLIHKILNIKAFVLISNFIFQGILYMSTGEKIFKISVTLIFSIILHFFIRNAYISVFLGHLINYIFNGQYFVVYRYLGSEPVLNRTELDGFIRLISTSIEKFTPIDVLIIGSFCRGEMRSSSDLDIRIYHDGSFFDSVKAYTMAFYLRFKGLIMKFPIDVYCYSNMNFMENVRKDEIPVNFLESQVIKKSIPNSINVKSQLEVLKFT